MAVREGQRQIGGDSKRLGRKGISSPSADPRSGSFQLMGDTVKLGRTPITSAFGRGGRGEVQEVGDKVTLGRKPVKGWGSAAHVPHSPRAMAQNNVFGRGRGSK